MTGAVWIEYLNEVRAIQPDSLGRRKLMYVDNCASHNDTTQALLTSDRLNIEIKKLPANSTDLYQLADSFVISKIKDAWSLRWEAYKLYCVQTGVWQDEVREDGRASGMLKNLGKIFFMELAVATMKDVNEHRDQRGINFAQKSIIRTDLARNVLGGWHALVENTGILTEFSCFGHVVLDIRAFSTSVYICQTIDHGALKYHCKVSKPF